MAMEKNARAEVIAALITDRFSGFKDGDEAVLEACSDSRLEEFRAMSETRKVEATKVTKLETDLRNTAARLKIAEDRIKSSEAEMSEEEFLSRAPARIKTLIEAHSAQEAAIRAALVSQLKDLGGHSEDELKKKSIDELKVLASYARVQVPDFSGRGLPVERHASDRVSYAPPNPYEEGLKALRSKAH